MRFFGRGGDRFALPLAFQPPCIRQNVSAPQSLLPLSIPDLPAGAPAVKNLWNIADLIDLHYFRQTDEELLRREGEAPLVKRDRIIYLAKIAPQFGKADDLPPRILVRKWLAMRRLQHRQERGHVGQALPGTLWRELTVVFRGLACLCGLLAGLGLAGSLLLYSGSTPLNVSVYFGLFVVLQLLMVGGQSLFFLYRRLRRIPMESTVLYALLGRLLMRTLEGVRRRLQRRISGQRRLDLAALLGSVQQHKELAALLIWPAFILVQLGGIGFNLGIIGATLAKVAFADIAFAWQSSLQLSAQWVANLVGWIALPWSWIAPQTVPSLAQIQGSQMVLKEGMVHLATSDLVAWWPFLCCAVAFYGLLPRCLLLTLGLIRQRQALEQLHFATLGLRPLLQRMTVPRIDAKGAPEPAESAAPAPPVRAALEAVVGGDENPLNAEPDLPLQPFVPVAEGMSAVLLIPDELYEDCPQAALLALLQPGWGAAIACVRHGAPDQTEADTLSRVRETAEQDGLAGVLLLQEAWQPPLKETEQFLRDLRRSAGALTPLVILLIGKPSPQTLLTPADPEQLRIWRLKMQALGDPCLEVHPLVQP